MDALSKWASVVDKYAARIGPPQAPTPSNPIEKPKSPEETAAVAANNIMAEAMAIARAAEAKILEGAPPTQKAFSEPNWDNVTAELERWVDRDNLYHRPELSSSNAFMVWAYCIKKLATTEVNSMLLAQHWWDYATWACAEGFRAVWGNKPRGPNCQTCKPEAAIVIYDGENAPGTIEEIDWMISQIWKLSGGYASFKTTLLNLRDCLETQEAFKTLIPQGDDFFHAGRVSYNLILAGAIGRALARGVKI